MLERAEGALVDLNVALREMGADSETLQRVAGIFRQVRAGFDGIDWPEIRLRYEVGGLGLSELARRFGVNKTTIGMRAEREKWTRPPGFDARAARRASLVRAAVRRRVVKGCRAEARPATDRVSARRAALLELIGELAAAGARSLSQDQLARRMKSGSVVPDIAALVADGALAIEHGGRKGVRYTVTATGQATDWTSPPKPKATKTVPPRVKAVSTSEAGASTRKGEVEAGRTRKRDAGHKAVSPASGTPADAPLPLVEVISPQAPPSAPPPAPAPAPVKRGPGRPRSNWQEPAIVAPANTVDLAKRYLQQRGIVVFAAAVADRPNHALEGQVVDELVVDGRRMSVDDMVARAAKLGFQVRA